jgi:tetratricopeptide (TPR) repeat protein
MIRLGQAAVAQGHGRAAEALETFREVLDSIDVQNRRYAYIGATEAAWALRDEPAIESLLRFVEELPPVEATPLMRGQSARFAGLLAARRGDVEAAGRQLDDAISLLRELGYRFELGKALLDRGEVLQDADGTDDATAFIDEARTIFADLGARPWQERADRALARPASAA